MCGHLAMRCIPLNLHPGAIFSPECREKIRDMTPLAIMVELTHAEGLEFHAWMNPLRIQVNNTPEVLSRRQSLEHLAGR